MSSYQYGDSHVKDKTVSSTVLSLTWESPYLQWKRRSLYWDGAQEAWLMHRWQCIRLLVSIHYTVHSFFSCCLLSALFLTANICFMAILLVMQSGTRHTTYAWKTQGKRDIVSTLWVPLPCTYQHRGTRKLAAKCRNLLNNCFTMQHN